MDKSKAGHDQAHNFNNTQRETAFQLSANYVRLPWPAEFRHSATDHYMCAYCRFVHSDVAVAQPHRLHLPATDNRPDHGLSSPVSLASIQNRK